MVSPGGHTLRVVSGAVGVFPRLLAEAPDEGYGGGRVRLLAPEVAHRIAAGEVIERPASAVKELVENALDAGAWCVRVEVSGGGVELIRVRDDGSGMSAEDAGRAVREHATSKIFTAEDLGRVASLGFRGEALHAIGAVSELTLTTRERGSRLGWAVRVLAGQLVDAHTAAHEPGTTVEVRNLFLNLPVRRGFLGTVRSETNAVVSTVQALALSRPEVGFFLKVDGREALAFPAAADLRERIAQVHGLELARVLVPVVENVVWGFVSPVEIGFPTRRYLHVAVNGRVVEPDAFAPAVAKAYADLLPKGRHPAAFLRLELGAGEVDVNVHPAKSAVRLRGGRSAYPLVVGAIRTALELDRVEKGHGEREEDEIPELAVIGQFAGRLILAQRGEELVILDQHGAHERVLYERLAQRPAGEPEPLKEPAVVRLPEEVSAEVWDFEDELGRLGFRFEPFGAEAVRLLAAPRAVGEATSAFVAALEALVGGEDLAKALACRDSVKFGAPLPRSAMEELVRDWSGCDFPEVCPHGRPIVRRLRLADILREFGRG
jgi:DNA mismatch repair protein MutL